MKMAPVATSGSLQTTVVNRRPVGGASELRFQQTANVKTDSYIWQPWFARLNGDLSLSFDSRVGGGSRNTFIGTGTGTLSILPLSNYPVTISLSHADSRVIGGGFGDDQISDRAALSAGFVVTQSLRGSLSASWERSDRLGSSVLNNQSVGLSIAKSFRRDNSLLGLRTVRAGISLRNSTLRASDPDLEDRDRLSGTFTLNTESQPFKNAELTSTTTAAYDDHSDGTETSIRKAIQGVSTLQWRPEDKPFVVTGTLRTLSERIERDGVDLEPDSSTDLAAFSLGTRYRLSDQINLRFGINGSYSAVTRDEGSSAGENSLADGTRFAAGFVAGADFTSERSELGGFNWQWNASVETNETLDSEDGILVQNFLSAGQTFDRRFEDLFFVPVRFSFSQQASLGFVTAPDTMTNVGVSHSASLDYTGSSRAASTFARVSFRDIRNVIGDRRETQTLQARFGRRISLDSDRRLQGNITAQAARSADKEGSNFSLNAQGNINYSHRHLFNVENLSWSSDLQLSVVDVDRVFGEGDGDFRDDLIQNNWRNVLRWYIGRMNIELEGTVFQRDTGLGYLAMFRLRRDFGRVE